MLVWKRIQEQQVRYNIEIYCGRIREKASFEDCLSYTRTQVVDSITNALLVADMVDNRPEDMRQDWEEADDFGIQTHDTSDDGVEDVRDDFVDQPTNAIRSPIFNTIPSMVFAQDSGPKDVVGATPNFDHTNMDESDKDANKNTPTSNESTTSVRSAISKPTLERVQAELRALTLEHIGARYYGDAYACAGTHWYRCEGKDVTTVMYPYTFLPSMPTMMRRLLGMLDGTWYLEHDLREVSLEEIQPLHPTIERKFRRRYNAILRTRVDDATLDGEEPPFDGRDLWDDGSTWCQASTNHDWTLCTTHLNCFVATAWPDVRPAIQARVRRIATCDEFCVEDSTAMEKYASTILGLFGSYRTTTNGKPADRLGMHLGEHPLTQELCELVCVANRSAHLVMREEVVQFDVPSRLEIGAYVVVRSRLLYEEWCESMEANIQGTDTQTQRRRTRVRDTHRGTCAMCNLRDLALTYGVCSTCPRIAIVREHAMMGKCKVSYLSIKREPTDSHMEIRAYEILDISVSPTPNHVVALCELVGMHDDSLDWRDSNGRETSSSFGYATLDASILMRRNLASPSLRQVLGCSIACEHDDDHVENVEDIVRGIVLTDPNLDGWFDVSVPIVLEAESCATLSIVLHVRVEQVRFTPQLLAYDGAHVSVRTNRSRLAETMLMWLGLPTTLDSRSHHNSPNEVLQHRMIARDVLRRISNVDALRTGMDHSEREYAQEVAKEQATGDDVVAFNSQRDGQNKTDSVDDSARNALERTLVAELNRTMEATQSPTNDT